MLASSGLDHCYMTRNNCTRTAKNLKLPKNKKQKTFEGTIKPSTFEQQCSRITYGMAKTQLRCFVPEPVQIIEAISRGSHLSRVYLLWRASGQLGMRRLSSASPTAEGDGGVAASSGTGREPTTSYATEDAADPRGPRRRTGTAAARRRTLLLLLPPTSTTMITSTSSWCLWWRCWSERGGGAARAAGFLLPLRRPCAGCIDVCSLGARGRWMDCRVLAR